MLIWLSIYAVSTTFLIIGYALYVESKMSKIQFQHDTQVMENAILQREIAHQKRLLEASNRGWRRSAGGDPLAIPSPETPIPLSPARRVRGLTSFHLRRFDEMPTYHMRSVQ